MTDSETSATPVVPKEVTQHVDPRLTSMFVKPESLVGVHSTFTHVIQPLRPATEFDQEFIFEVPYSSSSYRDMKNADLYVRGCLKRRDGTKLADDEKAIMTNNALHSLFESVTLLVGHNQTEIGPGH